MTGKAQTMEKTSEGAMKLVLSDRGHLELHGVCDVISFDDVGALIKTVDGMLAVDGEGLHVITLDVNGGSICFEGRINGLFFSDSSGKGKGKGKRSLI